MRPCPLRDLASFLSVPCPAEAVEVTGVTLASQEVRPGDLYAALPGARRHGAEFIADAAASGAVAVLTDARGAAVAAEHGLPALMIEDPRAVLGGVAARVYGDPTSRLRVLGITGTNGKTSTAYLIEAGLRAAGRDVGIIGTVATVIGDETLTSVRTTPEAPDLQALFAYALEQGVTDVVMEVSSHALAQGRADGTTFAVGGFTMFGVDHLDFHADMEDYFAAKAKLFDGRCRSEVVNLDDQSARRLIKPTTATYTVQPADASSADWAAADITGEGFDQRFTVRGPGGFEKAGSVRLPGRHNVSNALLAVAMLAEAGVDPAVAVDGVATCRGIPGRMERVGEGPVLGVVDYAHKPDAIHAVLEALRAITPGRVIAVIGAGGDRDQGKRVLMGKAAAHGADLVIVTDDNPRTEDPAAIRGGVIEGIGDGGHLEIADRAEAIASAVAQARDGDTVAVLGKGHEQGQELAEEVVPFDDRVVLGEALDGVLARNGGRAGA
ncbi:UDP-N-acetylmuramoyl-L-alanyl-D-glutamate--2,6-diaminopimelate ligase [Phytomonospora sp. NPDC050363]|uniref:UDP-N-acetylmuramoyl-L-alanyl-D-glutamate--2, 6-diaminopimelate ligase n=1 Tax=Phytomonospora sp. NPDC050363 TaxID=3155642 RepID=UPI0033E00596